MTTLPLPERPRTPTVRDSDDGVRGLAPLPLRDTPSALGLAPELSVSPGSGLSISDDLSIGQDVRVERPVDAALGADLRLERASSDAAMLEGVTRVAAGVEVLVGLWLAVSPWLVGSNGSAALRWSNLVVGVLLVALGGLRVSRPATPRGPAISFGLGAWTIVAAFVLSFQNGATGTAPLWSAIACGAVLTGAAAWATTEAERAGLSRQ